MTLLILAALLAGASALWVIQPILARRAALLVDTAPGQLLDAEARKRVALASLKEIEYDYLAGKLDDADYRAQRARLSTEALAAIHAADAVQAAHAGSPAAVERGAWSVERDTNTVPVPPLPSWGRGLGGEGAHDCGFLNPADSRFCAGCGARLV